MQRLSYAVDYAHSNDTPHTIAAYGSRHRGALEGSVADGVAIVAEDLSGPARGSSRVVS